MADAATTPLLTSHEAKPAKALSIDDAIETYIGATGARQLLTAMLLAFAWAFEAQQVFMSVFTDAEPTWHCTGVAAGDPGSFCSLAAASASASACALPPGTWEWDRPAETSVVSEWALKCGGGGPALVSLPASSFFAGNLAGGFLLTTLADTLLGRRKMLVLSLVTMSVAGVLTVFSPNVWVYAALRFVCGFCRSTAGTSAMVLSTELVGKWWRNTLASFFASCAAYDVLLMYSIELFPTSVRNSAVGLVRQAGVLGGVVAPMLVALGRERSYWSFGVFGLTVGCLGLFVTCLPETKGRRLSDTMEDEEEAAAVLSEMKL
uniref:H(+)/Pi cotransporter n=1 Tax=Oryza nivara TaxID=4536 RepID=A0A0E0I2C8_ORYNI